MIDMSKTYGTECGEPVRLLCNDADGPYPVIGLIDNKRPCRWSEHGQVSPAHGSHRDDLVEVSPYADWPIDAPIFVRDNEGDDWRKRHFAGVSLLGFPMAWSEGRTSWSEAGLGSDPWAEAKRPEMSDE